MSLLEVVNHRFVKELSRLTRLSERSLSTNSQMLIEHHKRTHSYHVRTYFPNLRAEAILHLNNRTIEYDYGGKILGEDINTMARLAIWQVVVTQFLWLVHSLHHERDLYYVYDVHHSNSVVGILGKKDYRRFIIQCDLVYRYKSFPNERDSYIMVSTSDQRRVRIRKVRLRHV